MVYVPVDVENAVLRECKRRRLSPRTAKTYIYCIDRFLKRTGKTLDKISKKDVRLFLEHLSERDLAGNTMNTYHMAIRFLFENVLEKRMWIDIKYFKTPKRLPEVLSKEEVRKLLNAISNWKHRLMIEFLYGSGLRVSELINMRIKDLNLDKNHGYVRNGKGGKDILITLSKIVKEKIINLIEIESLVNEDYVFQSNRKKKYNVKSLQKIVLNASKKVKLNKRVHPHTLRHNFSTHLIENGYDINNVQAMLGHKSPETTMICTHIASPNLVNTKSPLDEL
jgi:integrase/recombinase XerD